ncbi:hypothetical protein ACRC6Q_17460 [Planococcus sp. SE5232]|uniref:hypothetical protein n=1 Tax=unclassified Planococcus (in: firmicutes) TaxID=2662419 RepID=UPI003D6A82C5
MNEQMTQEKEAQEKSAEELEISHEVGQQEEKAVGEMEIVKVETIVTSHEIGGELLRRLQKEGWEMVVLSLKDPTEINVPSDDFNEPHVAHAVLSKYDFSMNYAWLEINEVNSRFNEIWQSHWGVLVTDPESLDEDALYNHLTSIQRKYESLLNRIRVMEFKSSTAHAQHLHDYKLYLEGAILYRIEAASLLLEAVETGQRTNALMDKAAAAAVDSEVYAKMSDSELTNYERSFRTDSKWNPE